MRQFTLGVILGSLLTGSLVGAGTLYNSSGQPAAPSGSIQQFDYFRQRQQFLDLNAMRPAQEESRHFNNPCGR